MRALLLVLLVVAAARVRAADEDAAALSLADRTPVTTQAARDWRASVEAVWGESALREGASAAHDERLVLDFHYDKPFVGGYRLVFADLLDSHWQAGFSHQNTVNTVIDAYLS